MSQIVQRARRATAASRCTDRPDVRAEPPRLRRGIWMLIPSAWRRCEMGTNHIACYGVWRISRRRDAERINRSGETRWHRPYRLKPSFTPGEEVSAK